MGCRSPTTIQLFSMSLSTAKEWESRRRSWIDGRDAEQILIVDKSRQHFMWLIHDGLFCVASSPMTSTLSPTPSADVDWLDSIGFSGCVYVGCGSHGAADEEDLEFTQQSRLNLWRQSQLPFAYVFFSERLQNQWMNSFVNSSSSFHSCSHLHYYH